MWLITFSGREYHRIQIRDRWVTEVGPPFTWTWSILQHPVRFIVDRKRNIQILEKSETPMSTIDVDAILFAIEIPGGMLTAEEIALLS